MLGSGGGGLVSVRKVAVGARMRLEVGAPCCARISMGHKVCMEKLQADGTCPRAPLKHTIDKIPQAWKEGWDPLGTAGGELYVIPVHGAPKEAHLGPILEAAVIADIDRVEFENKTMSVSDWSSTFAQAACAQASKAVALERFDDAAAMLRTPLPTRLRGLVDDYDRDPVSPPQFVLLSEGDEGVDRVVVKDLQTLTEAVTDLRGDGSLSRLEALTLNKLVEAAVTKQNLLGSMMGQPGEADGPTVWSGICEANQLASEAQDSANQAKVRITQLERALEDTETRFAQKLEGLASQLQATISNGPDATFDRLIPPHMRHALARIAQSGVDARVESMAVELGALRAEIRGGPRAASIGGGMGGDDIGALVDSKMEVLQTELAELGSELRRLKTAGDSTMITIGDVSLSSQKEAEAFVFKNGLDAFPFLFHSVTTFMEVLKQSMNGGGCADNLVQADKERKLGLSPVEMAVQESYLNILPSVMGDGKKANKLSACPSYSDWHNNDYSQSSVAGELRKYMADTVTMLKNEISMNQAVSATARYMLVRSVEELASFVERMISFVTEFYQRYVTSTSMGEDGVWSLVQFLLRAMFDEFNTCKTNVRNQPFGDRCRKAEQTGRVLWACFQMHGVARSYPAAGWEGHPTLSPAINKFLLIKVSMKTDYDVLKKQIEGIEKNLDRKVQAVGYQAQRAQGTADKKKPAAT